MSRVELPWANVSQRWGHPLHSLCSYLGTFPPVMARALLQVFSDEGDLVLDPFCGRGTTSLEARLTNRRSVSSDQNPLAVALTAAKNVQVDLPAVLARIDVLERRFDLALYAPEAHAQPDEIQLIYHPYTLAQLCFLQRRLLSSTRPEDVLLVGIVLGLMHGGERSDGGSAYASISMPNTFSMSPEYVRRFVQEKELQRVERNVFQLMRDKVGRVFPGGRTLLGGAPGTVVSADAKALTQCPAINRHRGQVDLILTSPPYLNIVNYALQNWIRLWFLDQEAGVVDASLDDHWPLGPWLDFMEEVLAEMALMLAPGGTIVLVIGDVAKQNGVISPARELIRRVIHASTFDFVGCAVDHLDADEKVSRIWKETKGRATAVDRVVVLGKESPITRQFDAGSFGMDPASVRQLEAAGLQSYAASYAGLPRAPSPGIT